MRRQNPQKAFEKTIATLKALGLDTSSVEHVEVDKTYRRHPDANSLELIACIVYLDTGGSGFSKQICAQCGEMFAVEYMYRTRGMMCSDECRAANLEKRGLFWDSKKPPHERWKKRIPVIVPPAALKVIEEIHVEKASSPSQSPEPVAGIPRNPSVHSGSSPDSQGSMILPDLSEFDL